MMKLVINCRRRLLWCAGCALVWMLPAAAVLAEVDYAREVKPLLRERCYACHGALKQESGLRLDTAALMRQGGDSGPAVVAGQADSLLLARVSAEDAFERMPPEGQPLTSAQISLLRAWVRQGAQGSENEQPEEDPRDHWAFRPPRRAELDSSPGSPGPSSSNPIDALLAAERKNLKTVPFVDRRLLLRRVYLDLVGLPPTRAELHAFLEDTSPDAYSRVVDRLLDSPHYGERWGRHWMDIWRYTDWYGLGKQLRYSQKHIWHWRDWIVESLNEDKGYDRMVVEMLAADEVAPRDRDALRATGFLARNYFLFNRTTWLDNTVEHTSKAFLGLTLNCTKCHDHKYDPIRQEDYYRMRAIFEPHQVRLDPLPGETDLERDGLPRVFDAHPDAKTYLHVRGDAKNPDTSRDIPPGPPAILATDAWQVTPVELPVEAHYPALQPFVLADQVRVAEMEIAESEEALEQARLAEARFAAADPGEAGAQETAADAFLNDAFDAPDPRVWETGPGDWEYRDGRLVQSQRGATRCYVRTRAEHPRDFIASLRVRVTGGDKWKSVGLCFDVVEGREKLVYLSGVTPGSKLQISYKNAAANVYPPKARRDRTVNEGQWYELQVRVRDALVNVAVDGAHLIAYRLPVPREPGRLDVIAFDAAAEFDRVTVSPLPKDARLVEPAGGGMEGGPSSLADARAAVTVAEKVWEAARLRPAMLRAAHAADRAPYDVPQQVEPRQRAAALAARRYELAEAEAALARAARQRAAATDQEKAQKVWQEASTRVEQARQALEQPGLEYPSLRASLKALEGPDETEASRRKPYPRISTGRRAALAEWITDRQNPLAARVAVNHLWLRHFGQPLVDPVTDFGLRTAPPVQQKLLDWLAVEFMENGWRMKHLHRLIVTSDAYRLDTSTASADPAALEADPENEYYWRRKPVRMEAQVIRDSLLHLAGVLDPALGGPTIDPRQDTVYRRSLYFTRSRDDQHPFLTMFNDADILRCYRRDESIVPQQALALANSKLSLSMARRIAANVPAPDDDSFLRAAFETVLCVAPTDAELHVCREALEATRRLLGTEGADAADVDARARANVIHALLNHNDFITVR